MTLPVEPFTAGQHVTVRWDGDDWRPAIINRVYEKGLDATIEERGCFYVRFPDVRALP